MCRGACLRRPDSALNAHPNALVGGGSGIGAGVLIVLIASKLGLELSAYEGAVIAGGAAAAALFIGRNGVRGLARIAWSGKK